MELKILRAGPEVHHSNVAAYINSVSMKVQANSEKVPDSSNSLIKLDAGNSSLGPV